jgi:hypothetical protein
VIPGEIVVFLGPSLSADEARRTLRARYLSPVRCGDVLRVRRLKPRAVAIVDGLFESVASVWHKEILLALEDGIAVYGATSMGALRAAELEPFGMIGIGTIFEAYRDGVYTDDDEVALLHGPAGRGYPAMSEPMVNIRATVAKAVAAGVIGPASAARVIGCAKDTFYQERSLDGAIAQAWGMGLHGVEPERFRRFVAQGGYVNQKRLDTLALLRHLGGLHATRSSSRGTAAPVHRSSFVLRLQHDAMCAPFDSPDVDLPREEHVALESVTLGATYPLLRRLSQFMAIAHALARARDLRPTPERRAAVFQRDDFGLGPAARTRRWAGARDLDDVARASFVDRLSVVNAFVGDFERRVGRREARRQSDARLLDLMRLDDRYASWRPRRHRTGASIDRAVLRNAARLSGMAFDLYRRTARLWSAVDDVVDGLDLAPIESAQALSDEFRRMRGLDRRTVARAWMRANHLTWDRYVALVSRGARLSTLCEGTEMHALGLVHLAEPACWLLDAIRLAGIYAGLKRRVCYGVARSGPARHPARRIVMAKAKTAKAAKAAKAKKTATVKDLAPKNSKAVKGGAVLLRKKVYE